MAAPLAVWALHFVAVYSLQGVACARQVWRTPVAGLEPVTWALALLTVLALAAIALPGAAALRAWRRTRAADDGRAAVRRERFLWALTALAALAATIAVLFTATPIALLPTCG
ncbi:hypothetical protein LDO26_11535 [Luteimonas sp. BDR2-5]|uniref:hypothetical protein n=1 Tax=Proluteimonas luteida TaxID=2878685 RepID=UPI001E47A5C7|nr:hypothetical protein [Luteimonas sp. BDR2-5]MCD9028838.1 hypothetical protein [Luteimonas sp. BDR2-5]